MSTESHHSVFRHPTCVNPKRGSSITRELNFNQIHSPVRSCPPQEPQRKRLHELSVDWVFVGFRSENESSLDEDGQNMSPNAFQQKLSMSSYLLFLCPSRSELLLQRRAHFHRFSFASPALHRAPSALDRDGARRSDSGRRGECSRAPQRIPFCRPGSHPAHNCRS